MFTGVREIREERRKWENIFVNAVINSFPHASTGAGLYSPKPVDVRCRLTFRITSKHNWMQDNTEPHVLPGMPAHLSIQSPYFVLGILTVPLSWIKSGQWI